MDAVELNVWFEVGRGVERAIQRGSRNWRGKFSACIRTDSVHAAVVHITLEDGHSVLGQSFWVSMTALIAANFNIDEWACEKTLEAMSEIYKCLNGERDRAETAYAQA